MKKEYKEFVPDLSKTEDCIIKKSKRLFNFDRYEYINSKNLIVREDEFCYEGDKEVILSTRLYKYDNENFYCKHIYYFFGTSTPSIIQYKQNNNCVHNPFGPALLEFDEHGALRKCSYFINNLYHRLDGPAIEWYENDRLIDCSYYINGKKIKDEFVIAIIDVSRDDD